MKVYIHGKQYSCIQTKTFEYRIIFPGTGEEQWKRISVKNEEKQKELQIVNQHKK